MSSWSESLSIELLWVFFWGLLLVLLYLLLQRLIELLPLGDDRRARFVRAQPLIGLGLALLFSLYSTETLFSHFPTARPFARLLVLGGFFLGAGALVRDFFAGIAIRSENSLNLGDHARIGTVEGRVTAFGSRGITLESAEGATSLVPYSRAAGLELTRTLSAQIGASHTFTLSLLEDEFSELKQRIEHAALTHHFSSTVRAPEVVLDGDNVEITLFVLAPEYAPGVKKAVLDAVGRKLRSPESENAS